MVQRAKMIETSAIATRPRVEKLGERQGLRGLLADWDLLALLVLILADIRIFSGSSVASFTLYELYAWGYCMPYVIGHVLRSRKPMTPVCSSFVFALGLYIMWILFSSLFALLLRGHSDVLQQAKNIMPALPLVCFVFVRLRSIGTVARLANLYILYCVAASILAVVQFKTGGPYFRPPVENNAYKLDLSGDLVDTAVLGFSNTPNEFAVSILPGLMFAGIKLTYEIREKLRPQMLTLLCCVVVGSGLILSESRGALVWMAFGLTFMVAPTRNSRSLLLKLTLVTSIILLSVLFGLHAQPTTVQDIDNTVEGRLMLWKTAFYAILSDPYIAAFGDGMQYVITWSWKLAGWEFPDAHNGWIDQALFFGLPTLILYLGLWQRFFAISDGAALARVVPRRAQTLLDGIRGSVLAFMGLYFFEPVAHAVLPVSQIFLLMSCGISLVSLSPSKTTPWRSRLTSRGLHLKDDYASDRDL